MTTASDIPDAAQALAAKPEPSRESQSTEEQIRQYAEATGMSEDMVRAIMTYWSYGGP